MNQAKTTSFPRATSVSAEGHQRAAAQQEQLEVAQVQLALAAPKVAVYNAVVNTSHG